MEQIGEFHGVTNEEHREIQAYDIQIPFLGIKFHSKSTRVSQGIGAAFVARHGGKPDEHRRHLARLGRRDPALVYRAMEQVVWK